MPQIQKAGSADWQIDKFVLLRVCSKIRKEETKAIEALEQYFTKILQKAFFEK